MGGRENEFQIFQVKFGKFQNLTCVITILVKFEIHFHFREKFS